MPGGRPTLYTPELLKKAREYLKVWPELEYHVMPNVAGLAIFLKISRETIYAWVKEEDKEEFSDIYKELMAKQELILASKGLSNEFSGMITKLMLTKHGLSDKSEVKADIDAVIDVNWEVTVVGE